MKPRGGSMGFCLLLKTIIAAKEMEMNAQLTIVG